MISTVITELELVADLINVTLKCVNLQVVKEEEEKSNHISGPFFIGDF